MLNQSEPPAVGTPPTRAPTESVDRPPSTQNPCPSPSLSRNPIPFPNHHAEKQAALTASAHAANTQNVTLGHIPTARSIHAFLRQQVAHRSRLAPPSILTVDLAVVARQVFQFHACLPGVQLYYAIKCFPDVVVLSLLACLGASFDCAAKIELTLAQNALRAAGVSDMASRIIFANPVKAVDDLRHARTLGVTHVTFDSVEEARKLARHMPDARAILRLATEDESSSISLSEKFGVHASSVRPVLRTAAQLNVCVVGIAFHAGSGAQLTTPYTQAIHAAARAFAIGAEYGFNMHVVDIGGGFPGVDGEADVTFSQISACVREAVSALFSNRVSVIAEPGRFVVHRCATLSVRVVGVVRRQRGRRTCYRVADSVFGSFRDAYVTEERFEPVVLHARKGVAGHEREVCDVVGVTGEPVDVIAREVSLPLLAEGDWLLFSNMGSYTTCLRTRRPDVPEPSVMYVFSDED